MPADSSLAEGIASVTGDQNFYELVEDEKTRDLLIKGHGGVFAKRLREQALEAGDFYEGTTKLMEGNTIKERMESIRNEAIELKETLDDLNDLDEDPEAAQHITRGKALIAEYLLLDRASRSKAGDIDEKRLCREVPWDKVDDMLKKGPEKDPEYKQLLGKANSGDISEALGELYGRPQNEFLSRLVTKKEELNERDNKAERASVSKSKDYTLEEKGPGIGP